VWPAPARPSAALRGATLLSLRTDTSIQIEPPYCGPADRANGGYVAGLLSPFFDAPFQVTYRRPVPLGRPVRVHESSPGDLQLIEGETVLAEARVIDFTITVPPPPSREQAAHATLHYVGLRDHPFPRCFVCGTQRADGDGLRIFAGPVEDEAKVAAPWTPHRAFASNAGRVRSEVVWAALDCPGCFAALLDRPLQPAVLGRFAATVSRLPKPGEPCVVYGWPIAHDGRKHRVGTALVDSDGALLGCAESTWIDVPHGDIRT
jgi:hypothetical protein